MSAAPDPAGAAGADHRPLLLHVITGLDTGGAERSLLKLATGLGGGFRQAVVSLIGDGALGPELRAAGVPVTALGMRAGAAGSGDRPGRAGRPSPTSAVRLLAAVSRSAPAIVQGWMYHGNLAAWLAGRLAAPAVPVLWNLRHTPELDLAGQKGLTAALIRFGAPLAASVEAVVYNARVSARRHARLGYRPARREIIPNGFDVELFRPRPEAPERLRRRLGLPPESTLIGLVARWHPIKGHPVLLEAVARLADRWPRLQLVLAGRGADRDNRELAALAGDLGLAGRVHPLGEVADVAELTAGLDVACLTSHSEGFPNVVGEAMACGVPCAVTDVGDAAEMIGESGEVAPPGDPQAYAAALARLLALAPEERRRRGELARRRVVARYALEVMLERYRCLYCGILESHRGAA